MVTIEISLEVVLVEILPPHLEGLWTYSPDFESFRAKSTSYQILIKVEKSLLNVRRRIQW